MENGRGNFVETREVLNRLSDLLRYHEAGLSAMSPVIRASEDGVHKLLVLLVKREGECVLPSSIVYCDISTGTFSDSENADSFFARHGKAGLVRSVKAMREFTGKEGTRAGRDELFLLLDGLRRKVASNGECPKAEYAGYLRQLLFPFSDEMAEIFLTLARGYETVTSKEVSCPSCRGKFLKDLSDCAPGQLVVTECPFCGKAVRMTYKKEGRCVSFRDSYFREERGIFTEDERNLAGVSIGNGSSEGETFSLSSQIRSETHEPTGEKKESSLPDQETVRFPKMPEDAAGPVPSLGSEEELVGLGAVRKVFGVIRFISERGENTHAQAYCISGGPGMGVLKAVRCLSGKKTFVALNLSSFAEDAVQGLRDAAVIVRCNSEEDAQGEKLYLAFLKLDPSNVVFILDSGTEVPFALSQFVLQTIRFKPYSDAELFAIYRQKLKELGDSLNISPECEKKSLGRLSSSLDAVRIARETHFRHLLFCQSGKASGAEIGEREFERLLRELFPPLKEASKKSEGEN